MDDDSKNILDSEYNEIPEYTLDLTEKHFQSGSFWKILVRGTSYRYHRYQNSIL